jgi:hypothetical protein
MGKHQNVLASPFPNPGLIVLGLKSGRSAHSIHQELTKLGFSVELAWVERLVAGYFPKFAGISRWRQSAVAQARANKQVRTKIARIISLPDNATDTSLFCLPVQANGPDTFKLAKSLRQTRQACKVGFVKWRASFREP